MVNGEKESRSFAEQPRLELLYAVAVVHSFSVLGYPLRLLPPGCKFARFWGTVPALGFFFELVVVLEQFVLFLFAFLLVLFQSFGESAFFVVAVGRFYGALLEGDALSGLHQ